MSNSMEFILREKLQNVATLLEHTRKVKKVL